MELMRELNNLLGIYSKELLASHLVYRCLMVYCLGILLARFNKRFMATRTVNNFFLFVFVGSLLATSIVGTLFYETLFAVVLIFFINWLLVGLEYSSPSCRRIVTGMPIILYKDGSFLHDNLKKYFITQDDIQSVLRARHALDDFDLVDKAILETNGEISFVFKKCKTIS